MSWDQKLFARHLTTRRFGRELVFFESIDSTNSWLLANHQSYPMSGTVVVADHQTAGRGRRQRSWHDTPGHSVLCSILLRTQAVPDAPAYLGMLPAIALAQSLKARYGNSCPVRLKWPNDVLLNDKKVAGILAQSTTQANRFVSVVGLGVNVSTPVDTWPPDLLLTASSVARELAADVQREILLAELLNELEPLHDEWNELEFDSLRAAWEYFGPERGTPLTRTEAGQTIHGRYAGLGPLGQLNLETEQGGLIELYSGDITNE